MRILLSNDDGYQAAGIRALIDALGEQHELRVVAPDRDRSGASHSLTLSRPLQVTRHADGVMSVDGTPTDCVHLALSGLFDDLPDLVLSGINHGANLGDDVLYSGTVGAALEARFLGIPAIAVSLAGHPAEHFAAAAAVTAELIERIANEGYPGGSVLNVNIPDCPRQQMSGFAVTRLGRRHYSAAAVPEPSTPDAWRVGPIGAERDNGEGTDFWSVRQRLISITPLDHDLTAVGRLATLDHWLGA
ncbi:5'/3'-nucleotidase SurE [Gammaproteobacteria bacterium]|nr:5'/3'-nucleotidase SurE [Gammaproteobacteria bacterium]